MDLKVRNTYFRTLLNIL